MNDVKEPKAVITVEEAFELTKKHLLFTISDNESKSTYYESMGLDKSLTSRKDVSKLSMMIMMASTKTDIAKIILENSNSLAEVIILLHGCLETNYKMQELLQGRMGNLLKGLESDDE